MRWEPSVRTRHLAVIIILILIVTGTLLCFNVARLLNAHTASKVAAVERLTNNLFSLGQQAINNRPLEEPQVAIALDESVRSLLKSSTGENKGFIYCAMRSTDGAIIAQYDPLDLLQTVDKIKSLDEFQTSRWYSQLWQLMRQDYVYETTSTISLSKKPFAEVVAGVPAETFRSELSPSIKLSIIIGLIMIGLCVLIATLSSNLVLLPLREVIESIEQLEVDSAMHSEPRPVNVEMQSIAQRLRELGRRFAGNRTEIEAIRDQLQTVVGSLSERVLLLDRERRVIMASPEAERMLSGGRFTLRGQRLSDAFNNNHPIASLTERAYQSGQSLQELHDLPINGSKHLQKIYCSLQIFEDRG
jgi:PAS domain-containing protein